MKVVEIVFSPTGGTKKVADIITEEAGEQVKEVDLSNAKADYNMISLDEDDIAILAVPSFGGRVPAIATERIERFHGNNAKCVIVCVYGNRAYEDTLIELKDVAEKSGFRVVAAIAGVAEHSIVRQYGEGRPDAQDKDELSGFAKKIFTKLKENPDYSPTLNVPGNRPYKKSGKSSIVPSGDDRCTGCGICVEICPVQAISKENPKLTDSDKCISCMRCVAQCPQAARNVDSKMLSAVATALKDVCATRKNNELFM